jgi:hypothetical protein
MQAGGSIKAAADRELEWEPLAAADRELEWNPLAAVDREIEWVADGY